eukprot:6466065-Amphidinium_carterae.1
MKPGRNTQRLQSARSSHTRMQHKSYDKNTTVATWRNILHEELQYKVTTEVATRLPPNSIIVTSLAPVVGSDRFGAQYLQP